MLILQNIYMQIIYLQVIELFSWYLFVFSDIAVWYLEVFNAGFMMKREYIIFFIQMADLSRPRFRRCYPDPILI